MPAYGYRYDPAVRCRSGPQPGVLAFAAAIEALYPDVGSYGIFNCRSSRTGKSLSLHGEGRAWDCAIPLGETALGNHLALLLVSKATLLGIQRVIWGFGYGVAPKEWDSREGERYWESYFGPAHDDHLHIEFCWMASAGRYALTKEYVISVLRGEADELTDEEKKMLKDTYNAVFKWDGDRRYEHLNVVQNMLTAIGANLGIEFDPDGTVKEGG